MVDAELPADRFPDDGRRAAFLDHHHQAQGDHLGLAAQPTGYAPEENALSMSVRMGDFTNVPGGFPIEVGGEVIGAVAAGGAKIEQDVVVAKAALAALDLPAAQTS